MKKRKILAMLMTATLSVGMLAGCGTDSAKDETKKTEEAAEKFITQLFDIAALTAISAVSPSRISPIMMISGS